jgi:hypothetical protein
MDPDKAKGIVTWPRSTDKNEVQQLLRLGNFYWRFVPGFVVIISPITDRLRGNDKTIFCGDAKGQFCLT